MTLQDAIPKIEANDTTLKSISFRDNKIGAAGAKALADALEKNTTLTSIDLENNHIDDAGAKALAKALEKNTTLRSINLRWNQIGVTGAADLAEALKKNTTLKSINFGDNQIGNDGAAALAEALLQNTTLSFINLRWTNIGVTGAADLAEALLQNTTLSFINLERNSIGDEGATALAEALKINTTLSSIDLRLSEIGDAGTKALADALEKNTTLKSISLRDNPIGDEGATALAEALLQNTTLSSIDLRGNEIGNDGATVLAEALKKNTTLTFINLEDNQITTGEAHCRFLTLINRNKKISNIRERIASLEKVEFKDEQLEGLHKELGSLQGKIDAYQKQYPDIHNELQNQFNACMISQSLKHGDIITALNVYANTTNTPGEVLFSLAEQLFVLDLESDPRFKESQLNLETKQNAALAVLSQIYQNNEAQRLIKNIVGEMMKQGPGGLNVSLVIPEVALLSIIDGLSDKTKRLENIKTMNPQAISESCQKEPLKGALEQRFGTASIMTIESALRLNIPSLSLVDDNDYTDSLLSISLKAFALITSQKESNSRSPKITDGEHSKFVNILSKSFDNDHLPERYSRLLNARGDQNSAVLFFDYASFLRFFRNRHYVNEAKNLAQKLHKEPSPEIRLYLLIEEYKNKTEGGSFNENGSYGRRLQFSIAQEARKVEMNIKEEDASDHNDFTITHEDIIKRCYERASEPRDDSSLEFLPE